MDELTRAIASFDWNACRRELERDAEETLEERCERLEARVRESGRLMIQRPDAGRARRRDQFVASAKEYLANGVEDTRAAFERHVEGLGIIEAGFHSVLAAVRAGPQAHLTPDVHVWALIDRLAREDTLMHADVQATIRREPFVFDPFSLHIVNDQGDAYRPDAVKAAAVNVFSNTLLMLGHQNGWFRAADGALELPAPVALPDQATFRAGLTVVLGQGWRLLDYATERWRFFGGRVARKPFSFLGDAGEQREIDAIWFENDNADTALTFELLDTIAHGRLTRLFMQVHMELETAARLPRVREDATELAPTEYVSLMEVYSLLALCHALHFDVSADDTAYADLRLREWARGYATLVREAEKAAPEGSPTLSWAVGELVALLRGAGLSEESARVFIERVTFGQQHGDLFDAPLFRTQDGRIHCLPHILRIANVPRIILSHLSELSVQILRRGPALEDEFKKLLRKQGFRCERLHFWQDDEEYECDAAIVWERTLFLFECKNRSLSAERPARRHRFVHDVLEGTEQLERFKGALPTRPDVVRAALGADSEWDRIVCCVLNGLPFSIPGARDDIYISDMSALSRFFQGPTINVVSPRMDAAGRVTLITRPIRRLWAGEHPTVADFLAHLEAPTQVMSAIEQYQATQDAWTLGSGLAIVLTIIRMVPRSLEASLKALGAEGEPAVVLEDVRGAARRLDEGGASND